jgi:hypothetical protein
MKNQVQRRRISLACALSLLVIVPVVAQQTFNGASVKVMERHAFGQTVAPIYEGWSPNADGTRNLWFGYMNRNYDEQLDIPVGPNNFIEPGPADQGQPTHFLARRNKNMFAVVVPGNTPRNKNYTWTLTIRGNTDKVSGSLNPIWQVDHDTTSEKDNLPPVVKVGPDQAITLPATATLSANVSDDGNPKPRSQRGGGGGADFATASTGAGPAKELVPEYPGDGRNAPGNKGLTVEWSLYRGPGNVTFSPEKQPIPNPSDAKTTATFSAPGDYTILVVADDGSRVSGYHCCWTNGFIKVTVKGTAPSGGRH